MSAVKNVSGSLLMIKIMIKFQIVAEVVSIKMLENEVFSRKLFVETREDL